MRAYRGWVAAVLLTALAFIGGPDLLDSTPARPEPIAHLVSDRTPGTAHPKPHSANLIADGHPNDRIAPSRTNARGEHHQAATTRMGRVAAGTGIRGQHQQAATTRTGHHTPARTSTSTGTGTGTGTGTRGERHQAATTRTGHHTPARTSTSTGTRGQRHQAATTRTGHHTPARTSTSTGTRGEHDQAAASRTDNPVTDPVYADRIEQVRRRGVSGSPVIASAPRGSSAGAAWGDRVGRVQGGPGRYRVGDLDGPGRRWVPALPPGASQGHAPGAVRLSAGPGGPRAAKTGGRKAPAVRHAGACSQESLQVFRC